MTPTKEQKEKALAALGKQAGMMPGKPTAITFDRGWEIIDCVQDDIMQHLDTIRALLSAPEQESVTVVTREQIREEFIIWNFSTQMNDLLYHLMDTYPNGLRIIRAEQGEG